jgi:hypothetical protein
MESKTAKTRIGPVFLLLGCMFGLLGSWLVPKGQWLWTSKPTPEVLALDEVAQHGPRNSSFVELSNAELDRQFELWRPGASLSPYLPESSCGPGMIFLAYPRNESANKSVAIAVSCPGLGTAMQNEYYSEHRIRGFLVPAPSRLAKRIQTFGNQAGLNLPEAQWMIESVRYPSAQWIYGSLAMALILSAICLTTFAATGISQAALAKSLLFPVRPLFQQPGVLMSAIYLSIAAILGAATYQLARQWAGLGAFRYSGYGLQVAWICTISALTLLGCVVVSWFRRPSPNLPDLEAAPASTSFERNQGTRLRAATDAMLQSASHMAARDQNHEEEQSYEKLIALLAAQPSSSSAHGTVAIYQDAVFNPCTHQLAMIRCSSVNRAIRAAKAHIPFQGEILDPNEVPAQGMPAALLAVAGNRAVVQMTEFQNAISMQCMTMLNDGLGIITIQRPGLPRATFIGMTGYLKELPGEELAQVVGTHLSDVLELASQRGAEPVRFRDEEIMDYVHYTRRCLAECRYQNLRSDAEVQPRSYGRFRYPVGPEPTSESSSPVTPSATSIPATSMPATRSSLWLPSSLPSETSASETSPKVTGQQPGSQNEKDA